MPRLRRVDSNGPGIQRRGRGRGFEYLDDSGRKISEPAVLARIRSLAIPPAWKDVWICPDPDGHLQAVGTDAAGRKQYRYHDRWRHRRDQEKFDRMLGFCPAAPSIAPPSDPSPEISGMTKPRVLACAVRLLDLGFFRIGSETYVEDNGSFGLATLLKEHVRINGNQAVFDYQSKRGIRRVQVVRDSLVLPVVRSLKRRRGGGPELLAYRDKKAWIDIRSGDINDYIKDLAGEDYTAKDFRTWNATLLASVALASNRKRTSSSRARKRHISEAVKFVSFYLGNTPAVCRGSYIDPRVVDCFEAGEIIQPAVEGSSGIDPEDPTTLHGAIERATIELLESNAETTLAA